MSARLVQASRVGRQQAQELRPIFCVATRRVRVRDWMTRCQVDQRQREFAGVLLRGFEHEDTTDNGIYGLASLLLIVPASEVHDIQVLNTATVPLEVVAHCKSSSQRGCLFATWNQRHLTRRVHIQKKSPLVSVVDDP